MPIGLVIAGVAAVTDWISLALPRPSVEALAKPAVMVGLILHVVLHGEGLGAALVVGALTASLLGDVLLLPRFDNFLGGLGAFLAAHVLFVFAFLTLELSNGLLLAGVIVAVVADATLGRRIVGATTGSLLAAVGVYVAVLGAMIAAAMGTADLLIGLGALVFAASDGVLGWSRFVHPLPRGRLITHLLYHVGQALIVVGFVGL